MSGISDTPFKPGDALTSAGMQARMTELQTSTNDIPQEYIDEQALSAEHVPALRNDTVFGAVVQYVDNPLDTTHSYMNFVPYVAGLDTMEGASPFEGPGGVNAAGWRIFEQVATPLSISWTPATRLTMAADQVKSLQVFGNVEVVNFEIAGGAGAVQRAHGSAAACILWQDDTNTWHCLTRSIRHASKMTVDGTDTSTSTSRGGFDIPLATEITDTDTGGDEVQAVAIGVAWFEHFGNSGITAANFRRGNIEVEPVFGGDL